MTRNWGEKRLAVVCDIDEVIATGTAEEVYSDAAGWAFENCTPIQAGIAMLNQLRERDVRIILHTARWEEDRLKTERWLGENEVPYDELVMGKPSADLYIDDKAGFWAPEFRTIDGHTLADHFILFAQANARLRT